LQIYYSLDSNVWERFQEPISISSSCRIWLKTIKTISLKSYESAVVSSYFIKKDAGITLHLSTPFSSQYAASGANSLIDGIRGGNEYRTGDWQGFYGKDVAAEVVFSEPRTLNEVGVSFIRDVRSWIFFPSSIRIETSVDGVNYTLLKYVNFPALSENDATVLKNEFLTDAGKNVIKSILIIQNAGNCPKWHLGNGNPSWLFLDELIIR